jgi:hypothetical protein
MKAQAAYDDAGCVKDADTCSLALCDDTRPPTPAPAPTADAFSSAQQSASIGAVALLPLLMMLTSL